MSFNHPMVKVKDFGDAFIYDAELSFNHPMVKVKAAHILGAVKQHTSFNHPMVKVKVMLTKAQNHFSEVSTTLW